MLAVSQISLQLCLKFHIHSEYTDPFQTSLMFNVVVADPVPSCFYLQDAPRQGYSPNTVHLPAKRLRVQYEPAARENDASNSVQPTAKRLYSQFRQVAHQSLTSNPVQSLAGRPQMQSGLVAQQDEQLSNAAYTVSGSANRIPLSSLYNPIKPEDISV
jgi:hypothetical protein